MQMTAEIVATVQQHTIYILYLICIATMSAIISTFRLHDVCMQFYISWGDWGANNKSRSSINEIKRRSVPIGNPTLFISIQTSFVSYPKEFYEGHILVESEPIRYELREIKKDKWRTQIHQNKLVLREQQLSNDDEATNSVETVMSYQFERIQYWGTYEGVARGSPTEVFETGKPSYKLEGGWGTKLSFNRTEVSGNNINDSYLSSPLYEGVRGKTAIYLFVS